MANQQPIEELLANTNTEPTLRARLQLLEQLRDFGRTSLKLPVDDHYRKYVDIHRPFVVWNVEAAPEFSMEAKTWWYPVIGRQEYRGYFSSQAAHKYGDLLKRKRYDVSVGGSEAYSTLGWFKDPVINTFVFEPEPDLAEVIFHELGHQRLFARGDTDFNEAFATTVGQEGARRWLAKRSTGLYDQYIAELRRTEQFVHLVMGARLGLETLYGDERTEEGKVKATARRRNVPPEELRREKQKVFDGLKRQYTRLKEQWGGNTDYEQWFSTELNNAQLNSVATYYDLVPGFMSLLRTNGGDLEKFYEAAERLSKLPRKERHERLVALGQGSSMVETSGGRTSTPEGARVPNAAGN